MDKVMQVLKCTKYLVEKQELMRQELDLSIAKQSLELNSKLSIAAAKQNGLCELEVEGILLSVSRAVRSEHGTDINSPPVTVRQFVNQAENTPRYASSSSYPPVHPSVRTVSNPDSNRCPSVTVYQSADTVSFTTAVGIPVNLSVSIISNPGSARGPSNTVHLSTDNVSFTTAVGTLVNPSASTVNYPGSTRCPSITGNLDHHMQWFFNVAFSERQVFSGEKTLPLDHKRFWNMVGQATAQQDGHCEVCLPLRDSPFLLPNNRPLAVQQLKSLKKKFSNTTFQQKYCSFYGWPIHQGPC